jgi:hypothetical protein
MSKSLNRAGQGVFGVPLFVLRRGTMSDERIHLPRLRTYPTGRRELDALKREVERLPH